MLHVREYRVRRPVDLVYVALVNNAGVGGASGHGEYGSSWGGREPGLIDLDGSTSDRDRARPPSMKKHTAGPVRRAHVPGTSSLSPSRTGGRLSFAGGARLDRERDPSGFGRPIRGHLVGTDSHLNLSAGRCSCRVHIAERRRSEASAGKSTGGSRRRLSSSSTPAASVFFPDAYRLS